MKLFNEWWSNLDSGAPTIVMETEEDMAREAFKAGLAAAAMIASEYQNTVDLSTSYGEGKHDGALGAELEILKAMTDNKKAHRSEP